MVRDFFWFNKSTRGATLLVARENPRPSALNDNLAYLLCDCLFLIYRMNDSGYDSPFLGGAQSRHMAASADESLEEVNMSLR